jgi:methylmalonyl-CoA/ethylmalonyl-CoA epimerase
VRLDHVALASRDSQAIMRVLVRELGGTVTQGAVQAGFRSVQVCMGDAERGMIVELLEPDRVEEHDFLERFLEQRGPGAHHLTFKVDDLVAELDRVRAAGLHPTGIFLDSPRWKECFLHPGEAHGTVVQLAQGGLDAYPTFAEHFAAAHAGRPYGEPVWWEDPGPRAPEPTILEHVVVSTPELSATTAFYTDVLAGEVVGEGAGTRDLAWPGGRVRLELDPDRPPGIARLDCTGPGPARTLTLAATQLAIRPRP